MDNKQVHKQLSDLALLSPQPKTISSHVKSTRNSLPGQFSVIEQMNNDSEGEKQSTNPQEKDEKFQKQQEDNPFYVLDEQIILLGDYEHLE